MFIWSAICLLCSIFLLIEFYQAQNIEYCMLFSALSAGLAVSLVKSGIIKFLNEQWGQALDLCKELRDSEDEAYTKLVDSMNRIDKANNLEDCKCIAKNVMEDIYFEDDDGDIKVGQVYQDKLIRVWSCENLPDTVDYKEFGSYELEVTEVNEDSLSYNSYAVNRNGDRVMELSKSKWCSIEHLKKDLDHKLGMKLKNEIERVRTK